MDSQLKISRAITNLAFSQPFFGSCLMQLNVTNNDDLPTMATNGESLFWNSDFVNDLKEDETRGVLAHEVMHVILKHCKPHKGKDAALCNVAMDWVINEQLDYAGFTLPSGALRDPTGVTNGWAWEEVYRFLDNVKSDAEELFKGTPYQNDENPPRIPPSALTKIKEQIESPEEHVQENSGDSEAQQSERDAKIDEMIVKAANAQEAAGRGTLPGDVKQRLKEIRSPKVNWREELFNTVKSCYPEDYSLRKPNRRHFPNGLLLPSMVGERAGVLAIGLDASGSMDIEDFTKAVSEVNYIVNELKPEKVYLLSADYAVTNVKEYDSNAYFTIEDFELIGGGGTSFTPVFEKIEKDGIFPDQVIYFSDMYVNEYCFPDKAPDYPVTFVSTRADYEPPFGKTIVIQD